MRMETNTTFGSFSVRLRCFNFDFTGYFHCLVCRVVKKTIRGQPKRNPNRFLLQDSTLASLAALGIAHSPTASPRSQFCPAHVPFTGRPKPVLPPALVTPGGLWAGRAVPGVALGRGSRSLCRGAGSPSAGRRPGLPPASARRYQCPPVPGPALPPRRPEPFPASGRGGAGAERAGQGRARGTSPLGGRQ